MPDPDGLDGLSLSELRGLVVGLIGQVRALTDENWALRDEVARLKGLPPRPPTRPTRSGMEAASERVQSDPGKRRRRGPVLDRCVVTREVVLKAAVPEGSRFKGFEDLVVRDLVLEAVVIRYRRERWCTPSGTSVVAPLPPGLAGGFGPHLRRFLLAAHVQGQVTSERLTAMLSGLGLTISKRAGGPSPVRPAQSLRRRGPGRSCARALRARPGSASTTPPRGTRGPRA